MRARQMLAGCRTVTRSHRCKLVLPQGKLEATIFGHNCSTCNTTVSDCQMNRN